MIPWGVSMDPWNQDLWSADDSLMCKIPMPELSCISKTRTAAILETNLQNIYLMLETLVALGD